MRAKKESNTWDRYKSGFTLIEILVVIVILSVAITMVTLKIGNTQAQELEEEAHRLQALFEFAQEYAVLQAVELGFYFEQDRYQVLRPSPEGWKPFTEEKTLRPRRLPAFISLLLVQEETPVPLIPKSSKQQGVEPQVLFLSSGELTPFELKLSLADSNASEFSVQGKETGEILLEGGRQ